MTINKKFMFLIILFYSFINYSFEHGIHSNSNDIQKYLEKYIINKIKNFSKLQQANIGAAIISSAPIPIFILILIFNIQNLKILDIMSSFAAGALIGDVFIHNLPEISHEHNHSHHNHDMNNSIMSKLYNLFEQNELLICWGILSLFLFEKLISYFEQRNIDKHEDKKVNKHHHGHGHEHAHHSNIVISLVGDFIHNLTDGMAIGAGFNKNLKIGVSLSLSIFFHEIPHEVGDFSYLLKQNMSITNAIISQLITALGSFFGVFLSFKIGEEYSDKIISFASGAFLYLAINTIMGDLKSSKSLIHIVLQGLAFIFGVYILDALI
jgi:zinc transporter ZupT